MLMCTTGPSINGSERWERNRMSSGALQHREGCVVGQPVLGYGTGGSYRAHESTYRRKPFAQTVAAVTNSFTGFVV